MQTYIILDAATVANLPEMLESSGLEHRCLFKGQAFEELKNVAPWLVRLEEGNAFTRSLFTVSEASWQQWHVASGLTVRSRGSFADVWQHLRKFPKVQNKDGDWFYYRFYANNIIAYYLNEISALPKVTRQWFSTGREFDIYSYISVTPDKVASVCTFHSYSSMLRRDVSAFDYEALKDAHRAKFADELARKISKEPKTRAKLSTLAKNLIHHGISKKLTYMIYCTTCIIIS